MKKYFFSSVTTCRKNTSIPAVLESELNCSIGVTKSDRNQGANSMNLFLCKPPEKKLEMFMTGSIR